MKKLLSLCAIFVLLFSSCEKDKIDVLQTNPNPSHGSTSVGLRSDEINVAEFHNAILQKFVNGYTESQWQSHIQGLNTAGFNSLVAQMADSMSLYLRTNYSINISGAAIVNYLDTVPMSFIDTSTWSVTTTQWQSMGVSSYTAAKINEILDTLDHNTQDTAACRSKLNYIKTHLSLVTATESGILENLCDFCNATNKLWYSVPGTTPAQGRDKHHAAVADGIAFVSGAVHGALEGFVMGGPFGSFAMGLMMGGFESVYASAATYWIN